MIFEITPKLATACLIFVTVQSFSISFIMTMDKKWVRGCLFAIFLIFYILFINSGLFGSEYKYMSIHQIISFEDELTPNIIDFKKPHNPQEDYFKPKTYSDLGEDGDEQYYDVVLSDQDRDKILKLYLNYKKNAQLNWDCFNEYKWWCPSEDVLNVRYVLTNLFAVAVPGTPSSKLLIMVFNTLIELGCEYYENWDNAQKNLEEAIYCTEMAEFYYYILTTH